MRLKHLHFHLGPNRHADYTLIEVMLEFTPGELERITAAAGVGDRLAARLQAADLRVAERQGPERSAPTGPLERFAAWLAALALDLQSAAGHRVSRWQRSIDPDRHRLVVLFEHEESQVGERAGHLALEWLHDFLPELDWPAFPWRPTGSWEQRLAAFLDFARALVMPVDTGAIIAAARRREVPVIKLERDPYEPVQGDFRIRPNSMLMLGHCAHRQLLDGTFAIERSGRAAPLLAGGPVVQNAIRGLGLGASPLESTAGERYRLIVANHQVVGVCGPGGPWEGRLDERLGQGAIRASRVLEVGLLVLTLACDPGGPGEGGTWAVLDIEVAPQLDRFLEEGSPLLQAAAGGLVDWLFPPGAVCRVPVLAVTGTNGKTTTSRMLAHLFTAAGQRTGLVCTDGRYVDGEQLAAGDEASLMGHYRVFESRDVELAVFETHHRGMAVYGFAFEHCEVAACTNVSNDHIGEYGIDSVAEMAVLKRSLLERARRGVVLNAEDPHCLAMIPHLRAPAVCLTATELSRGEVLERAPDARLLWLAEAAADGEWLVRYEGERRTPLMRVDEIPATLGGAARYNAHNALQAIASAHLAGLEDAAIHAGMRGFRMGFDTTPGRLNLYEGLPFRVVMDFAHNTDGIRRVGEFVQRSAPAGRSLLLFSAPGDRQDHDNARLARAAAGRFDAYFCRDYPNTRGRAAGEIPRLLQRELIAAGVEPGAISLVPDPATAVEAVLGAARTGDLVVLAVSRREFDDTWRRIQDFHRRFEGAQVGPTGAIP